VEKGGSILDTKKLAFQRGLVDLIPQTHNVKGRQELQKLLKDTKTAIRKKCKIDGIVQTLEELSLSGLIPREEALQIVKDQRDPEKVWALTLTL
jgi:hypothetical protein